MSLPGSYNILSPTKPLPPLPNDEYYLLLIITFLLPSLYLLLTSKRPLIAAMTTGMAHHLVRRAVDMTQQQYNGNDGEQTSYQLGGWALFVLLATVTIYTGMISLVSRLATVSKANKPQG